jgi:hypothetical protein
MNFSFRVRDSLGIVEARCIQRSRGNKLNGLILDTHAGEPPIRLPCLWDLSRS